MTRIGLPQRHRHPLGSCPDRGSSARLGKH
jgi:hypothetical protein